MVKWVKDFFDDVLMIVMYGLFLFFDYCIVYEIKYIWKNFKVDVCIVKDVGYDIYVDNVVEFNRILKEIFEGILDKDEWIIFDWSYVFWSFFGEV